MTLTIYGIPNCDTMKKARKWLDTRGLDYRFHDYKKDGIDSKTLNKWSSSVGYETLLNQRGTTWRKLDEAERAGIDEKKAIALMCKHPSLIKRPVLETGDRILVGFRESDWQSLL